jgi:hypothetical protein
MAIDSRRYNPLTPHEAPDLGPLRASFAFDEVEAEMRELFASLLTEHIRPSLNDLQTSGIPHTGSDKQFAMGVIGDGLSLYRGNDVEAMRYVWESWRARNPKRGLQMLKTYLQLIWPGGWEVAQLWQSKSAPYPTDLATEDDGARYLTSRVMVSLSSSAVGSEDVERIIPALRSVVPAKILLLIRVATQFSCDLAIYPWWAGVEFRSFDGDLLVSPPPDMSGVLAMSIAGTSCDYAAFDGASSIGPRPDSSVSGVYAMAARISGGSEVMQFSGAAHAEERTVVLAAEILASTAIAAAVQVTYLEGNAS